MSPKQDAAKKEKNEYTLDEALQIVGSGTYTNFLAVAAGIMTLGAVAVPQTLNFILPVLKCELMLDTTQLGVLPSAGFIGAMLSAGWMGSLVDQYGRRKTLLLASSGTSVFSIISSLSPDAVTLTVFIFITGFLIGGVFGNPYVYVSEFCSPKIRSDKLTIVAMVASLANTFSPGVAWLVMWLDISIPILGYLNLTSWRLFLIVNTAPLVISTVILAYLPESPKYLLSMGRHAEAMDSLSRVYAGNHGLPRETFPVERLKLDLDDTTGPETSKESGKFLSFVSSMWQQMKEIHSPPLLVYTVICSLVQFAVIGLFNVIYIWLPEEANRLIKYSETRHIYNVTFCEVMSQKDYSRLANCVTGNETYLVSIFFGVSISILCLVMLYLVRVFDLKTILGTNIIISGVICFSVLFSKNLLLTLTALGLSAAILSASQPAAFGSIVQFFPTRVRATATAVCTVFGRLAVPVGGPLYGAAFKSHCSLAYWLLSATLAFIGVISFLTPKKKKEPTSSL